MARISGYHFEKFFSLLIITDRGVPHPIVEAWPKQPHLRLKLRLKINDLQRFSGYGR